MASFSRPRQLITADVLPPAPKPGVYIHKLPGPGLVFNGTANAKTGAKVLETEVFGEAMRLHVHVVDRIMTPFRYFVISNSSVY